MKKVFVILLLGMSIGAISFPAEAGVLAFLTPEGSAAFKGKVVDEVTGKPLPGVIVIASWRNVTNNSNNTWFEGGPKFSCDELVNVESTVSGQDGSYEIPAWSGKHGNCDYMLANQPHLAYYKPGYAFAYNLDEPQQPKRGPYYTVPGLIDSEPVKMVPLGPHHWLFEDKYISNLKAYAWNLHLALGQDAAGPCFWKEETPVLLMLFREQRRLSRYADEVDLFNDWWTGPISGRGCADPAIVAALKQQAQATQPEEPILPYVRSGSMQSEASAPPKELRGYLDEEKAPGHADDVKYVIYHVYVNPANPFYLAVLSIGSIYGDTGLPGVPDLPDAKTLARGGIYGLMCPAFDDIPPAVPKPPLQYMVSSGPQMPPPPPPPRTALDRVCRWTVTLSGSDVQALTPIGIRWDSYAAGDNSWALTERSLVRPAQESAPEILEIDGPSLSVATDLAPAGPNRWYLPAGKPFTVGIRWEPSHQ